MFSGVDWPPVGITWIDLRGGWNHSFNEGDRGNYVLGIFGRKIHRGIEIVREKR